MHYSSNTTPAIPAKTDHIFVDGSNLFIEGMRLSSYLRAKLVLPHVSMHHEFDFDFRLDLRRLNELVGGATSPVRPLLVGSHSENSDGVFSSATRCGFNTIIYERDSQNREKKVDATIVQHALLAAQDGTPQTTRIVLVAGDSDYVPLVDGLRERGFEVEVMFWSHGSRELREAATRFCSLDQYIDLLRYTPVAKRANIA